LIAALREKIRNCDTVASRRSALSVTLWVSGVEKVMWRSRTVIAGAIFALAATGASAQTASEVPGKPLALVPIAQQAAKPKARPPTHVARKFTARRLVKRRGAEHAPPKPHSTLAAATPAPQPVQNTAAALPANIWPAADTTAAAAGPALAPAATATAPTAKVTTEQVVDTTRNDVVVDGHTMQVASPAGLSTVDPVGDGATTAANAAPSQSKPAQPAPVVHTLAFVPSPDQPSHVWSASWIAQVLAALGGAITAAIVAWFLILPGSPRDAVADDNEGAEDEWAEAEGA
jgi:hypothetical protein